MVMDFGLFDCVSAGCVSLFSSEKIIRIRYCLWFQIDQKREATEILSILYKALLKCCKYLCLH